MSDFTLEEIDIEASGTSYVAAMSETYTISFGNDSMFRSWAGPTGENYLQKLKTRAAEASNFCRTLMLRGHPVGLIEASIAVNPVSGAREGYIAFVFVAETARGRGGGSFLLEQTLMWAKGQKLTALHLTVEPSNLAAIRFYERHGWRDSGPSPKSPTARIYFLKLADG